MTDVFGENGRFKVVYTRFRVKGEFWYLNSEKSGVIDFGFENYFSIEGDL